MVGMSLWLNLLRRARGAKAQAKSLRGAEEVPNECLMCKGSGHLLSDQAQAFVLTLLPDEDIYKAILKVAKNLNFDIEHS